MASRRLLNWSLWLLGAAGLCLGCRAAGNDRFVARGVLATGVLRLPIELAAGASVELEALSVGGTAQPMLQLWDPATRSPLAWASSRWWRRSARLHYRNPSARARSCELLVYASVDGATGRVDLLRDRRPLLRAAEFGGKLLELASGDGISYRVAGTPGGPRAAALWGLAANGRIVAFDERSGPTGLPQFAARRGLQRLLLAPLGAASGRFDVYANDAEDRDGDGVGRRLERALGTCDAVDTPACRQSALADYYRKVGTRDSDRDGLSDADELFGVNAPGLDLPRYGADPRHKDVFIEVDHHRDLSDVGFSERDLAEIAALFARGPADALRNPDLLPGVRLHFDVGFAPADPAHVTLLGDYGGSGAATAAEYRAARKLDFSPERGGYFRYAFSTRRGRGQASRDAFTVNRDLTRVTIFAHELGHTLGLAHHGHDSWGKLNCKPNYYSIMNYLYQNRYEVGFSRGATRVLNPASVLERDALPRSQSAAVLREPPLELDVLGRDVDWNRDGIISDGAVRADLLWATYKSCAAGESGLTTLASEDVAAATPVLVASSHQLLAFWLDRSGALHMRARASSGLPGAEAWAADSIVPGVSEVRHIAGLILPSDRVALAYVLRDQTLHLATLAVSDGAPVLLGDARVEGAHTQHAPALASLRVAPELYGAERALGVFYRSATTGLLEQALAPVPGGPFTRRSSLDGSGEAIHTAQGPSVAALPTGELCGVFPDAQSYIRFYCYDVSADRWIDLTSRAFDVELGPRSGSNVGLAYHRYRDASGAPVSGDLSSGALYLGFSEPESSAALFPDNPHFYVSQSLSRLHGAREQISFRWRGRVITEWTNLASGSGVALFEDDQQSHLQALMVLRTGPGPLRLDFLPYADGELDQPLRSGNDFEVMERGICLGLKSEQACGGPDTAAY